MKILIKNKSKFALVGHGYHLNYLYEELINNNFPKPIIITHLKKFHQRDIREASGDKKLYRSVFELENKTKIYYLKTLNSSYAISILKKNKIDYIFSCSSRFIFKENIINSYKNKIFNIHPTQLPEEKGGGTYTYRIMNKNKFCTATIHLIDEGIDTGDILLLNKKEKLKGDFPIDFLIHTNKIYKKLIKKFINKIINKKNFESKKQDPKKGLYLPRFHTDISGAINWNWDCESIVLFIQACSKPYSGAFCYIKYKNKNVKIKILNADFTKTKTYLHPWFNGKIFYEDIKMIKVFCKQGYISILKENILIDKYIKIYRFEGKTLFNNNEKILESISHTPNVFKYK